ncbi:MAG: hypothetical protein KF690_10285 [Bacteroidetes bacterium]|nr:hypothetical protein [Bacteroidota bacterium]
MRIVLLLAICLFAGQSLLAQQPAEKVYQLSGMVLDRESNVPISYCKVATLRRKRLAVTNDEGFFTIPVVAGDTLVFQRIGYTPEKLSVNQYLKEYRGEDAETYLYIIQYLFPQDLLLDSIVIHPYSTPTELRTAILNMPTTTRLPVEAVNRHVSPEMLAYFLGGLPEDADDRLIIAQQRYVDYYTQQRGVAGTGSVADPIAIYNFIKYLTNRTQERRQENQRNFQD